MKSLIYICVVFLHFVSIARCDLQLKMLHVLFRHGDKVPHAEFQNYPNDPHRNHSYLPLESGGLTNLGMMREFKIGKLLREKYGDYFGDIYRPSLIYGQSTSIPRTKMSLQLVFAGLFPPSKEQEWNPDLPWLPTDFYFNINTKDNLLFPEDCPVGFKQEYKKFLDQSDVKKMLSKYQDTFEYLTNITGKTIAGTGDVYYLYNLLKEQAAQNLTLPSWTEKVYPDPMKNITILDFNLRSYTTKLRRLNGGLLLRKIVDDMKQVQKGILKPPERKAFFFSAHELNVAAFARVLGLNEPLLPEYGSTFIVETLQDEKNEYFVRVRLWTGVSEMYLVQSIPTCNEICPLDKFLKLYKDVIPSDKEYYCYGTDNSNNHNSAATFQGQLNLSLIILLTLTYLFSISLR